MKNSKRLTAVAPMLDWTDRHCRYFHRLISRHTWLYTEMVTTGALIHGDIARHLDFSEEEHPVALQLGGCDPEELAVCAKFGEKWGYDEINLNCGCPSERVQKGAFGACLMKESSLVAQCIKAIQDAVSIDVSVKHRIGVDDVCSYSFVCDFMGELAEAGCRIFIVHARNAILKGLSPKENRVVPPLHYETVHQLKKDFPDCQIILNGGIETLEQVAEQLVYVDGVMIGRAAYHHPYRMASFDARFYGDDVPVKTPAEIVEAMIPYIDRQLSLYGASGLRLQGITRHMLGLMTGLPGARRFRQILSDTSRNDPAILLDALQVIHF